MKSNVILITCFIIISAAAPVRAADSWSLELRGDVAVPSQDFGDTDLETGFGLEGTVSYYFMEHLAVYGGWGWHRFGTADTLYGRQVDVEETGYRFGLQFTHPIAATDLDYSLSIGGLYSHIELENDAGEITTDTGHGFGGEIGLGIVVPLSDNVNIMPTVRYHYLPRSLNVAGTEVDLDLSYFSCGASIIWSF